MPSNTLFYYLKQVERKAGLSVSSSFPASPTDEQQLVLDAINETLRYLNNKHYLAFKQTEYTLTTTAGQRSYDLTQSPYSQSFWRVDRLARNGIVRAADDFPLDFLDYSELDYLNPTTASNNEPRYYSQFGSSLLIHPPPDGSQLKVRYYGLYIGTDTTGATKKLRLSATDDLTMLEDSWEDCLTVGAAMRYRATLKVDEKFTELKRQWEEWEGILIDMGTQPGEDNGPEIVMGSYTFGCNDRDKFYPFFTNHPGA